MSDYDFVSSVSFVSFMSFMSFVSFVCFASQFVSFVSFVFIVVFLRTFHTANGDACDKKRNTIHLQTTFHNANGDDCDTIDLQTARVAHQCQKHTSASRREACAP